MGGIPAQLGYFFVAFRKIFLFCGLRFFGLVLSKFMRFFWAVFAKYFSIKKIFFVDFAEVVKIFLT